MKLMLIGVGQAGGKVTDEFLDYQRRTNRDFVVDAIAINTARTDLEGLEHIPKEKRVLTGEMRVQGRGVGADNELGAEIAEENADEITGAIDSAHLHDVNGFLIVAALGGGTGSGGAPVIAKHLQEIYREPVYGLGILPDSNEGSIQTLNAARSFRTFVDEVDNLMLFDNDAWHRPGETLVEGYDQINREIVDRFGMLLSVGEIDQQSEVSESVVDAGEIINTLSCGGVTSVGYAAEPVDNEQGLLDRFRGNGEPSDSKSVERITGATRKAVYGRPTFPCAIDSTERALIVVAGDDRFLSRKGIERSRRWLEQETGSLEVRGGDYSIPGATEIGVTVVLSGVTRSDRLTELQETAVDTQESVADYREERAEEFDDLVYDESDDLQKLY